MNSSLPHIDFSNRGQAFLLPDKSGTCRSCGGTYAPFSEPNQHSELGNICDTCMHNYKWNRHGTQYEEHSFNKFLADNLAKNLSRMKKYGVIGRCEALTVLGANPLNRGYQCGLPACKRKDGKIVCGIHAKGKNNRYLNNPNDPYLYLEDMISFIAKKDGRFLSVIKNIARKP